MVTTSLVLAIVALTGVAQGESDFWEEMANPGILEYRALLTSGRERIEAGDYQQALESLERARVLIPGEASAHGWVAYAQSRMGQQQQAAQACDRALELDVGAILDEERLALECAASFARSGRFQDAAEIHGQMLARGVSVLHRAAVLVTMGDMLIAGSCDGLDAAIELFQEAVRDYPIHPGAHWRLAGALHRQGAADEGDVEIAAALRLDPQWQSLTQDGASIFPAYDLHLFRALGWEHLNHTDQARSEWQSYLDGGGSEGCWADFARNHLSSLGRRQVRRRNP